MKNSGTVRKTSVTSGDKNKTSVRRVQTAQKLGSGKGPIDAIKECKHVLKAEQEYGDTLWEEIVEQTGEGQMTTIKVCSVEYLEANGKMTAAYDNQRKRQLGWDVFKDGGRELLQHEYMLIMRLRNVPVGEEDTCLAEYMHKYGNKNLIWAREEQEGTEPTYKLRNDDVPRQVLVMIVDTRSRGDNYVEPGVFPVFRTYQDENQETRCNTYVGSIEMGTLEPTVGTVYVTVSNPFLTSEDASSIIREAIGLAGLGGKYNVEREQASDPKNTKYFELGFESGEEAEGFLRELGLTKESKDAKILQWKGFQVVVAADRQVAISAALARRKVFDESSDVRAVNSVVLRADYNMMPVMLIHTISLYGLSKRLQDSGLNCTIEDVQNFGVTGYGVMQATIAFGTPAMATAAVKKGREFWEGVLPQYEALGGQVVRYKLGPKKRGKMMRRANAQASRPGSPTSDDQDWVGKSEDLVEVFADKFRAKAVNMEGVEQKVKELLEAGPRHEEDEAEADLTQERVAKRQTTRDQLSARVGGRGRGRGVGRGRPASIEERRPVEESNDTTAQKQAENEALRKELASRDREVLSQKRAIDELQQKVEVSERELKQQRVLNAQRESRTSKMPQDAQLRARLDEEKAQVKRLEAEKGELARQLEAAKLEAEQELNAMRMKVLSADERAARDKYDSIDAERISAEAVRDLDEQIRLKEEACKEVAALNQELAATKEQLRELSLHQSQDEDVQPLVDMSQDYQTQSGSEDTEMEIEVTEAGDKGNEPEESARRWVAAVTVSSEDCGEEQKKASAGGKGKRSQQSGRGAKPAAKSEAKKKQGKQAAPPAMTTRAKVKQERTKSSLGMAAEDGESWNYIPISNGKRSPEKLRDKEEAKDQGSGSRYAGSPKFTRGEGQ